MTKALLVWYLVTMTYGYNGYRITYSPPTIDLASCQRMQNTVRAEDRVWIRATCVQAQVPEVAR